VGLKEAARQIKESLNIVDLISEYVSLKPSGRHYLGLCPFHADRKPSFIVNEERQIFRCFGCGTGGDVIAFYMKFHNLDFVEAVKELAERYGIPISWKEGASSPSRVDKGSLFSLNEKAKRFFRQMLWASKVGETARVYLKERGLSQETAQAFELGFAPPSYDGLASHFKLAGVDLSLAEEAGLLVKREDGSFYDRFRERLIFPITDASGRVVGFGGRVLYKGEPKYLNTPETPIYHKGSILYGFSQTKPFIRERGYGFVVEGYLDLLSLYEHGVKEVVATLGTALTPQHVRLMKGLTTEWFLVFDADEAGVKAAMRAAPVCFNEGLYPKVMVLPEGEDPDSFVRQNGSQAFLAFKEKAQNIFDFLIDTLAKRFPATLEGKMALLREIQPAIEALKDPVLYEIQIRRVAERLGVSEQAVKQRLLLLDRRPFKSFSEACHKGYLERTILEFLVHNPKYIPEFEEIGLGEIFQTDLYRRFYRALLTLDEDLGVADLTFEDLDLQALLSEILLSPPPFEEVAPGRIAAEIKGWWLKQRHQRRLEELLEAIKAAEASGQSEEVLRLLKEYQELRCQI